MLVAVLMMADVAPLPRAQDEIVKCYAQRTDELKTSTETAPVVAEAVMSLCANLEPATKAELFESSVAHVQTTTGGSRTEAEHAVKSIQDEAWREWRGEMRARISAMIVRYKVIGSSK